MIKVMVVEDEAPILRNICDRIQESGRGFEVTSVAYNGREAVELLKKTEVDVMFVDMNLPVMNGMEVLSFAREHKPDIIPVVLSGYKDFEYVKHAFEHNVIDYLLKPLKEEELHLILSRIEQAIKGRQQQKSKEALEKALRGNEAGDVHEDKGYHMVIFTAGNYHHTPDMEGNIYHSIFNQERMDAVFKQHFKNGVFWCVDGGSMMDKVAFLKNTDLLNLSYMNKLLGAFKEDALPVTITVNRSVIFVNEIYDTYYKMRAFIENNMLFGQASVLIYHGSLAGTEEPDKDKVDLVIERCKNRPYPEFMCGQLHELLAGIMKRPVKQRVIRKVVRQFWLELCNAVSGHKTYVELDDDINFILSHNYTLEGMMQEFRFLLEQCFAAGDDSVKDKKILAAKMKQYLDSNYRHDITNQSISDVFGLVPSYLSNIFKEYYEVSMGEYLIRKRIETARQLLDEGQMKVKEVAAYVGYNDPLYFSKAFKKSVGMSPKEYQKEK